MPEHGVFAGRLIVEGSAAPREYAAVANWGVRPTFGGQVPVLEIHALDAGLPDLHGQTVLFDFAEHLRAEHKFADVDSLLDQIHQDMERARRLLS
jgi:riboflavin kinase/FMN adenylyltransferase